MKTYKNIGICITACILSVSATHAELLPQETLGKLLYFDENLSEPNGQSCASCHTPDAGWADPDRNLPVSEGVIPGLYGDRNSPSASYASLFPDFNYSNGVATGGQFWDGRAINVADQATGPFLNPVEMANPDKETVIRDVLNSSYVELFEEVCGHTKDDIDAAYLCVAEAIGAYESSNELQKFNSKFDLVMEGKAQFTPIERQGFSLFNTKGKCSQCHTSGNGNGISNLNRNSDMIFTDFKYHNLGLPRNTVFPYTLMPEDTIDLGLGVTVGDASQNGKFKTPHLRNIALTPPYMHSGVLKTLKDVVHFYNTRDVPSAGWNPPEVRENMELSLLGNLGLTDQEEDAIVAFMLTLTDDYNATSINFSKIK